jgi:hypothetical protein
MTRRESILREMGLAPLWRLRDKPALADAGLTAEGEPMPASPAAAPAVTSGPGASPPWAGTN